MDSSVFEVVPRAPPKKGKGKQKAKAPQPERSPVSVASPSAGELFISKEMESGVTGMAVLQRGSGLGMWASEVIDPIVARLEAEKEKIKDAQKDADAKLKVDATTKAKEGVSI